MNKTISCFVVVSGIVLSAGLAHADGEQCDSPMHNQSKVSQQGSIFNSADANKDGKLTWAEYKVHRAKLDPPLKRKE